MPEYLTQDEVDALEEGDVVIIRWADRVKFKPREHTVIIHEGMPHVREVKPSGFPVLVPLHPVADAKHPRRMRVMWPED